MKYRLDLVRWVIFQSVLKLAYLYILCSISSTSVLPPLTSLFAEEFECLAGCVVILLLICFFFFFGTHFPTAAVLPKILFR